MGVQVVARIELDDCQFALTDGSPVADSEMAVRFRRAANAPVLGGVWAGNACYNLVGDPEAMRACIEAKAVLPVSDAAKAKAIVSREPLTRCTHEGTALLY